MQDKVEALGSEVRSGLPAEITPARVLLASAEAGSITGEPYCGIGGIGTA